MEQTNDTSNGLVVASAVFAGLTAGLVLGLLIAPEPGRQTRRRLYGLAKRTRADLDASFTELSGALFGQLHELEYRSRDLRQSAVDSSELVERAESVTSDLEQWTGQLAQTVDVTSPATVEEMQNLLDAGDEVMTELELATKQLLAEPPTRPLSEPEL